MKTLIYIFVIGFAITGCATKPPIQLSELAPVQLCYELVTGNQRQGIAVHEEMQRRGESCDKYMPQVALMVQAEGQRRAALGAALSDWGAQIKENQRRDEDAYRAAQRAFKPLPSPINCTSQQGFGGAVNTTCR
jgi:hypothetical protein